MAAARAERRPIIVELHEEISPALRAEVRMNSMPVFLVNRAQLDEFLKHGSAKTASVLNSLLERIAVPELAKGLCSDSDQGRAKYFVVLRKVLPNSANSVQESFRVEHPVIGEDQLDHHRGLLSKVTNAVLIRKDVHLEVEVDFLYTVHVVVVDGGEVVLMVHEVDRSLDNVRIVMELDGARLGLLQSKVDQS